MTTQYGQFCPIAKATEILGDKWTFLIVRELLMGGRRYSDLQRGLTSISPTLLSKRLSMLDEYGLVYRRRIEGRRGFEYFPTEACQQLKPILLALGSWGMHWAKNYLTETDYDVELLMLYLERSVQPDKLPGSRAVIRFRFSDFERMSNWWLVVNGTDSVDVCTTDPGRDVDVYIATSVKIMTDVWMGRLTYQQAKTSGKFDVQGPAALTRNVKVWLADCVFADLPSPSEILGFSADLSL